MIRGVTFSKILVIDYEDGYHTFEATGKGTKKDVALFKGYTKNGVSFESVLKKNQLTVACTHMYSINLSE